VTAFAERPASPRVDHHLTPPTMPMPWGQEPERGSQS
jgi:hypothetical protein